MVENGVWECMGEDMIAEVDTVNGGWLLQLREPVEVVSRN